ncbi:MAG: TolC family protein [Gemmatimonadaceae bacterium]
MHNAHSSSEQVTLLRARKYPSGLFAIALMVALAIIELVSARPLRAQTSARDSADLASLVATAMEVNPRVTAARRRADAAGARIAPAGARPDPMLMAGIQNFPIADPGFDDFMTMKMVGIGQTIPYPGKLSLRQRAARYEAAAANVMLESVRLDVEAEVEHAYYELAFLDRALDIVDRNRALLIDFMKVAEARYAVGTAGQQDVLRVHVEAARLGEEAVVLIEQRRAVLARLNALLDRATNTPVPDPSIPRRIARAAVADSISAVRFVSPVLGARAAGSPLPAVEVLQLAVVRQNPELRAQAAMIAAQAARLELARKEHLPDFDVSLSYGQRDGFSDMVSAVVAIPIPIQRRSKQDQLVAEASAELAALESERHAKANTLRAEVARLHANLERDRAQLALYVRAIIPQGRAALSSATGAYQVGRADYLTLLDNQATLFNYETSYYRVLTDFAKTLAELEQTVGQEVLP